MKKILPYILLTAYSCLISSCTYQFDLDEVDATPKLVAYCYPGSRDTTVVRLYRSLPINEKGNISSGLKGDEAHLTVNGEAVSLIWTDDSIPSVPPRSYYAVRKYESGDNILLTAKVHGMKPVSATTVIPPTVPIESINLVSKEGETKELQFQIRFKDKAQTKDFYALKIEQKDMYWENGEYSEYHSSLELNLDYEPLLKLSSGLNDILMIDDEFYQNLYYWNDTTIEGKSYTLHLNTSRQLDYEDDFTTPDGNVHTKRQVKYRISLYSLSEEFYSYLKSLNEQKNNSLGKAELSPIRPTYTNVVNGLGVVGGCRISQTGWIDNLQND